MRNCVVLVVALLFMVGVAFAADGVMKQEVDGYTVAVAFEKMAPHVGENTLNITVTDATGKIVKNPVVKLRAHMEQQNVGGKVVKMGYMTAPVDLKHKGSQCVATVDLTMPGPWVIDMKVKKNGEFVDASFKVEVK